MLHKPRPRPDAGCPLAARELETVKWLSLGKTAEEAATIMGISIHTVNRNIINAMSKAGASKATGLVGLALRSGWIE
ncbi:helix-turn-helix transcriptional regulator [Ensifer sp. Root278]|uniref:helix-turn-helix transcriptional regulator n=1 Tax=Ensifer sp. Root278 TaxID=1736509 RepID=UPI0007104306|nr:helix-turn-helix transcriptional regulator [Ensifer sp. Root278]KRD56501.1 hypothetical protein ASE60_08565 [Ensifer sp. Root278]